MHIISDDSISTPTLMVYLHPSTFSLYMLNITCQIKKYLQNNKRSIYRLFTCPTHLTSPLSLLSLLLFCLFFFFLPTSVQCPNHPQQTEHNSSRTPSSSSTIPKLKVPRLLHVSNFSSPRGLQRRRLSRL